MDIRTILLCGVLLVTSSPGAFANSAYALEDMVLRRVDGVYMVQTSLTLEVGVATVQRVLTSPHMLPNLNPRIREVEVLDDDEPGESRVRLVSHRCVLVLMCRRYEWVQSIAVKPGGHVEVVFEPGVGSSVREGAIEYHLAAVAPERTRVQVRARLVPSQSLPPVIGPPLMEAMLTSDVKVWAENIVTQAARD